LLRSDYPPSLAAKQAVDAVLGSLGAHYKIAPDDMLRFPRSGPALVVADYPFGEIEVLILASICLSVRPDTKLLTANPYGLVRILNGNLLQIGNGNGMNGNGNLARARQWVHAGGLLVVAGGFAAKKFGKGSEWQLPILAGILEMKDAAALPLYVGPETVPGLWGGAASRLRSLLNRCEIGKNQIRGWRVHVGRPVSGERLKQLRRPELKTEYLKRRASLLRHRNGGRTILPAIPRRHPVSDPEATASHIAEVHRLIPEQALLRHKSTQVVFALSKQIPALLREIAKLRAIRLDGSISGNGLGPALDPFDDHYIHLFLWDADACRIRGACRLGRTDRIVARFGRKGLYTGKLFRYRKDFLKQLDTALEVNGLFTGNEHSMDKAALFLLWRGIARFVARRPRYRALYGAVPIGELLTPFARALLKGFLEENCFLNGPMQPRQRNNGLLGSRLAGRSIKPILNVVRNWEELIEWISEIESIDGGIPRFIHHLLKRGGNIIGCVGDHQRAGILNCLWHLDLTRAEPKLVKRLMGDREASYFYLYHKGLRDL